MIYAYLIIKTFSLFIMSSICFSFLFYRLIISYICLCLFYIYLFNYDIIRLSFSLSLLSPNCYDSVELISPMQNDSVYFWYLCIIGMMPDNNFVTSIFLTNFEAELSLDLSSPYVILAWSWAIAKSVWVDRLLWLSWDIPFLPINL